MDRTQPGLAPPRRPGQAAPDEPPGPDRRRTYLGVVLVELLVIAALWSFSRHFGY